jgi:hypothetical protein
MKTTYNQIYFMEADVRINHPGPAHMLVFEFILTVVLHPV